MSAEIEKKGKEKKLQKVFGSSEKISTFAVPTETEGNKKDKDGAMPSEYSGYGS